jgi:hypothetical protein
MFMTKYKWIARKYCLKEVHILSAPALSFISELPIFEEILKKPLYSIVKIVHRASNNQYLRSPLLRGKKKSRSLPQVLCCTMV